METGFSKAVDVFVVGGGPAGLATAIAARRRGLSVVVADGAIAPIDKSCGEGLMPDGVDALLRLGIRIPEREAYPFRGIRFIDDHTKAEAAFPRGTAFGIRRTHLHQIMVDRAAVCGARMLWQTPVTGLNREGAMLGGKLVRARWIVGADGARSRVRRWAGMDRPNCAQQEKIWRFAFRRHYCIAPWSDFMELHWADQSQIYVTPVGPAEVCVALVSSDSKLRLDDALGEFPELSARLKDASYTSSERGAITLTRKLRRVYRDNIALVGDASGGVDAITGEGLCLTFRQATLLADCLASGNLARYQRAHRALMRRPVLMSRMMLLISRRSRLRHRAMQVFESSPRILAGMLAMHVGEGSTRDHISRGFALGWELLKA